MGRVDDRMRASTRFKKQRETQSAPQQKATRNNQPGISKSTTSSRAETAHEPGEGGGGEREAIQRRSGPIIVVGAGGGPLE